MAETKSTQNGTCTVAKPLGSEVNIDQGSNAALEARIKILPLAHLLWAEKLMQLVLYVPRHEKGTCTLAR